MGKTPKKAAPGGDERNLYNRRPLKATTAASKASETNLHKRQRESENPNRSKLNAIQKNISTSQGKSFKSKLRVPTKFDLNCTKRQVGRSPIKTKEKELATVDKTVEWKSEIMQPESEEAEVNVDVEKQNENVEDTSKDNQESDKECIDNSSSETTSKEQEYTVNKEKVFEEEQTKEHEATNDSVETKEIGEHEENDLSLSFDTEDSVTKVQEEKSNDKDTKNESKEEPIVVEPKNNLHEKEDVQSESQTDTESYSVDVLESTTSELSETSETMLQNEVQKNKEKLEETANKTDVSFVSYDPAIMLKDVQIKLNDCMKENAKLYDTSGSEHSTLTQPSKDVSFGKTLRSISGRRSLSRMRYVTLREQRYSPNNSMFVNTSSASLPLDNTEDFKILRYSTGLSDTVSMTNGSSSEKKRKHDTEEWSSSMKKQKIESENSLLNTSISLLKGLRRPIQVSTPVSELKFQSSKLGLTDDESNNKSVNESTKKWCTIM